MGPKGAPDSGHNVKDRGQRTSWGNKHEQKIKYRGHKTSMEMCEIIFNLIH